MTTTPPDAAQAATPPREQMARELFKSDNDAEIAIAEGARESSAMLAYLRSRTWENCTAGLRQRCYRRVDVILDLLTKPPTIAMVDAGAHAASEWLDDAAPLREHTYRKPVTSIWHDMVAAMIKEGKQP